MQPCGPIAFTHVVLFAACRLPVHEDYGMTENLAVSRLILPGQNQDGIVGHVYPGLEDRVDPETSEI